MWKVRKKALGIVVGLAVLLLAGLDGNAGAATFMVRTDADKGPGSLRQAVLDANATPEADEIHIDPAVRGITLASEVNISDSLALYGGGATLKGVTTRLFSITGGTVKFDRLTFTQGRALSGNGGAVNIEGPAKVDFVNCTFFDNDASERGGAVCVASNNLDATTFLSCTVAGNSATNGGGVAVVRGGVGFAGSIVTGNTERGGRPQEADVYADTNGTVFNTGRYNVIGHTNVPGSFSSARGNHTFVSSADILGKKPLNLTAVDGVQVLRLSTLSGNVARDLIPMGSVGFPEVDERGAKRPQLGGLDAGAFELSPIPAAGIDLKGSPYIQLGTTAQYTVVVDPEDATRDTRDYTDGIAWTVSDATVLSVNRVGVVTALREGKATLTARFHGWDGAGNPISNLTDSITVLVGATPLPAPKVTLRPLGDVTMKPGAVHTLKPEVLVSLADVPAKLPYTLTVSVSDTGVASSDVSSDGRRILLAGKALGTSQITVTATASNSAGTGYSDPVSFTLTVSDRTPSGGGGGGGCDAGIGGLALALGVAFLLKRRG